MFPVGYRTRRSRRAALIAVALACAASTQAKEFTTPALTFNGFGTLGAVRSNEDNADFVASQVPSEGAGHSSEWTAKVDSRLGLQLTADFNAKASAVVQVITEQQYDGSFAPAIEWANISYQILPELTVRVGRTVQANLMGAGYRKVGYALPDVRPPPEVYNMLPVTNSDGIDLTYKTQFSDFTNTVTLAFGHKDVMLRGDIDIEPSDAYLITNNLEWGPATFFLSYSRIRLDVPILHPLFDSFRAFGPQGEAVAAEFDVDNSAFEIIGTGARYDGMDWFVVGEWASNTSRTISGDSRGWYVTAGQRLGTLTPYATVASTRQGYKTPLRGVDHPLAQDLNAVLAILLADASNQDRIGLGVRWDVASNRALKLQYDYLDLKAGSPGVLGNEQPDFRPGGSVSVLSATFDFVF